jgi:hypothetical protein
MAKPPDFSADTIRRLSERSAMICNNPTCATITVGPSNASGSLKLKLGEAAHIRAARKGARFEKTMNAQQRASIDNGIWLCANCHTLIDKNNGADFSSSQLEGWKAAHEEMIYSLLLSHRSPVPILRQFTEDGKVANEVVDALQNHGALFVDMNLEVDSHVTLSIERLRDELSQLKSRIQFDAKLKKLISDLHRHFRDFMNETSAHPHHALQLLPALRVRVGVLAGRLRDEFGCAIQGDLTSIIP